jgi:hypothetical protein
MSEPGFERKRATKSHLPSAAAAALGLWLGVHGCASQGGVTRLSDGSYRVECDRALLSCLEPAAKLCELNGYDVVSASEVRNRYGPSPWQADAVKSSATVRCRAPKRVFLGGLFEGDEPATSASASSSARPPRAATPSSAPPAAPPPAPPGCVPGTSLACAAVSGCTGAQVCAPDGRSFGPCECAAAAPARAADAGAP